MRKVLPITIIFLLLTLSITPLATAQKQTLAQEVFDTYSETLQREDIQEVLPQVLERFKAPDVQVLLAAGNIALIVANPDLLMQFAPDTDPRFVTLLKEDEELRALFSDPQMQELLQDPAAIDELAELLGGVSTDDPVNVPDAVNIPDPGLRHAIADALNIRENAPITRAQMESLRVLNDGQLLELMGWDPTLNPIQDLTGLEFAVNLEELDIPGHSISDVSPLAKLIKLDWLDLSGNSISDVSPLAKLIKLYWLDLSNNNISDVSPLSKLVNLEELALADNPITDATPLADLKKGGTVIEGVSISYGNTVNIPDTNLRRVITKALNKPQNAPIAEGDMAGLTSLEAIEQSITNLTGLESAVTLKTLDLSGNAISNISPLANLMKLEKLDLSGNAISNISPLANLEIFRLDLSGNNISNISPLANLANLSVLDLSRNAISDVSPIANWNLTNWRNLGSLSLSGNNISNISHLANLANLDSRLYYLDLSNNTISDISPLAKLGTLDELKLGGNPITNVAPLVGLRVSGTVIEGVSFDNPVDLPDPNLRGAIANTLNKPANAPITPEDMYGLQILNFEENSITDLTGLEFAVNLRRLNLRHNAISDISVLSNLTNLRTLNLNYNNLSNVTVLSNLMNLESLYLYSNGISDISVLSNLTDLRNLALGENTISDISMLSNLTNLVWLSLSDNNISDISVLSNLTNLETLYLSRNAISDVSALSSLTNLETLYLDGNNISNVSPLSNLTNLAELDLLGNPITDGAPLLDLINKGLKAKGVPYGDTIEIPDSNLRREIAEALKKPQNTPITEGDMAGLTSLSAQGQSITDLTGLEFATNLERLYLSYRVIPNSVQYNAISDISVLSNLTNLERLDLSDNNISDISVLSNLTNLVWLGLSDNNISDISVLSNLTNLVWLGLSDNNISDISVLSNLTNLETLYLELNAISDVSALSNLTNLETLDLLGNPITDGAPLLDLINKGLKAKGVPYGDTIEIPDPNLRREIAEALKKPQNTPITEGDMAGLTSLWAQGQSITDLTGLEFATNLERLYLIGNTISDISVLSNLTNLETLNLSGNNISNVSPLSNLMNLEWLNLLGNPITDGAPLLDLINKGLKAKGVPYGDTIEIPDPNLRREIAEALKKPQNTPITEGDMAGLTSLSARGQSITDLTGLEFATNLETLYLDGNNLSDISVLSNLTNLERLYLSGNNISNVSPLSNLTNLETLYLDGNNLSDISVLSNLTNLERLYLDGNNISNVSPLSNLTNLERLYLSGNNISNVSPLSNLTNLAELDLLGNPITDGAPLLDLINKGLKAKGVPYGDTIEIPDPNLRREIAEALKKPQNTPITEGDMAGLTSLSAKGQSITDLTGLEFATNLERLYLSYGVISNSVQYNAISDISVLSNLTNLAELYLSGNNILNVSPLSNLTNLAELYLDGNNISDISVLSNLTNLETLYLWGNTISDISVLSNLTNLVRLSLSDNNISDISVLSNLTNLETLYLNSSALSDISVLSNLTNLAELYLSGNNLSDISVLSNLTNLETLNLNSNYGIWDILPLAKLVRLRILEIRGTGVIDISSLSNLTKLKTLRLPNHGVLGTHVLDSLPLLGHINIKDHTSCHSLQPADLEPLQQVQLVQEVQKKKISSEGNIQVGTTKSAIVGGSERNRAWLPRDTVADDVGAVTLTVAYLNPDTVVIPRSSSRPKPENWKKAAVDASPYKVDIERAAHEWSKHSNIDWKFIESGKDRADVRILFLDPEKLGHSKWSAQIGAKGYQPNHLIPTMYLTTDFSYRTLLHEFGHVLGLAHEHKSPKFYEHLDWDFDHPRWKDIKGPDRKYKIINSARSTFGIKQGKWDEASEADKQRVRKAIDRSYFGPVPVDEKYSHFDPSSVMTYALPAVLLKAKTDDFKEIADSKGIGVNYKLSDKDKQFIKDIYGNPVDKARVYGIVSLIGEEDEGITWDWCWKKVLGICVPALVQAQDDYESTFTKIDQIYASSTGYVTHRAATFKWGGAIRVEVYLSNGLIRDGHVEMAITVLFYEGNSENTDDLEDIACKKFKIPLDGEEIKKVSVTVENKFAWWKTGRGRECSDVILNIDEEGLRGDIGFFPDDWATVTLYLYAQSVSAGTPVSTAPAAPSLTRNINAVNPRNDVNGDGQINAADLMLVSQYLGQPAPITPPVDVNKDQVVTITDLVQVAQHLNLSVSQSAPAAVAVPSALRYETVQDWIDRARLENDGSRMFEQGIVNLVLLLQLMVPEETALLHNYPNPFNPETWIPYHLAKPSQVALTIYTVDGKVVRHLDLGHQAAGFYQSKARAAHWDGRNAVGERVASGIYFYTLMTDEFAATRKMLIRK